MRFCDFCVRPKGQNLVKTLRRLHSYGYSVCCVETTAHNVREVLPDETDYYDLTKEFNHRSQLSVSKPSCLAARSHQLTILKRITLNITEASFASAVSSPVVQSFDIVAVSVPSEDVLRMAASPLVDIITIAADAHIKYSHSLMTEVVGQGCTFELQYSMDKQPIIYHSFQLMRCLRNKHLAISSGASDPDIIQSPFWLLGRTIGELGITPRSLDDAYTRILYRSAGRKYRQGPFIVSVAASGIEIPADEPSHNHKDTLCNEPCVKTL